MHHVDDVWIRGYCHCQLLTLSVSQVFGKVFGTLVIALRIVGAANTILASMYLRFILSRWTQYIISVYRPDLIHRSR